MTKNEGEKAEEAISNALLNFTKHRDIQFKPLSQSNDLVPSGQIDNSEDGHLKEFPPDKCENDPPEYENVRDQGGDKSNGIQEVFNLNDNYMQSANDQSAGEIVKPRSLTFTHQPFEHSKEPCKEDAAKHSDIKGLIDFIRLQEDLQSNTTNDISNDGPFGENSVNHNMQKIDNDDKLPAVNSRNEYEETSMLDFKSIDSTDSKVSNKDQKQLKDALLAGKDSEGNKVLVRFLPSNVTESSLKHYFSSCGEILKVEVPYAEGRLFKIAYVCFKTREGFQNALKRSDMFGNCASIIVESATSTEKTTAKIPVPCLIGDPDIPAALVKNPTRTVRIEQLTREISSHHIEEALSFCGSNISGYFLGSSHSVAYVEFETEIGKERALAKQSINVLGNHLLMLRIDSPRTTVVRISNIQSIPLKKIHAVCKSLGVVRQSFVRSPDISDMHFELSEWPNMLKILNRLNGYEELGRRLQAAPAPVFPPEVLLALWHQPEERKHLKAIAASLLHKLGSEGLDTSRLVSLEHALFD
ncbi:hypothetical protein BUALT_Bualt12G0145500 [Buddleja alternifolia]|uniref:RRM domain-containing protein n=1 Tax=Buddleja alternifolia TaxID=168488 RepID=A0AAV6WY79_9LAMI|nr:hypothetical protein BUALT_Bualt12G0145500 [Buddleja alternifolia]